MRMMMGALEHASEIRWDDGHPQKGDSWKPWHLSKT
jgi:hypothetical protein